jgi:cell fate regulator YaaT (PSP1 superfamily)
MGCTSCGNKKDGVPNGCKSNGNCATGGCEKMSVFNWLNDIEPPAGHKRFDCIEVSFKNGRKEFFKTKEDVSVYTGDTIAVEASPGYDVGTVTLTGELVKHQMNRKGVNYNSKELKSVYRKASESDLDKWKEGRDLENETMHKARTMALNLGLRMKLGDVEFQGDKSKAVFYYTAEERVDFRELIKVMADSFKIRIEMRQIGSRQEAGRLGGIGSCGRELCCSTWLTDFRSVSTGAARYQQLSLNPEKLAGQCGKLKCCLNFELDQYMEALKSYPSTKTLLETKEGKANHIKTDVFKRLMYYFVSKDGKNSIVPLSVERVFDIIELNKNGEIPHKLADFVDFVEEEAKPDYTNVVGQDELTRFDKVFKKQKKKHKSSNNRNSNKKNKPQAKTQEGNNAGGSNKNKNRSKNFRNKQNNQNKPNQPKSE